MGRRLITLMGPGGGPGRTGWRVLLLVRVDLMWGAGSLR